LMDFLPKPVKYEKTQTSNYNKTKSLTYVN
jgi:hypothetical protein